MVSGAGPSQITQGLECDARAFLQIEEPLMACGRSDRT